MVDFSKLMDQSPEERQAERERIDRDFQERNLFMISSRQAIIQECSKRIEILSAWEATFIESMVQKSETLDRISRLMGGELSCLSDAQVSKLSSIHARISSVAKEDSGLIEPKKRMQYPSNRMR